MSKEVGIDIVEFSRIKERMNESFVQRILAAEEMSYYHSITNEQRKIEFIAGRFAAKEAYSKLYKRFDKPLMFTDVKILKDEYGAPYIESKYRSEDVVKVSISHSENYAVAICILE